MQITHEIWSSVYHFNNITINSGSERSHQNYPSAFILKQCMKLTHAEYLSSYTMAIHTLKLMEHSV